MNPAFEKLGLAYGFLRSAFQGDEDRFVQSGGRFRVLKGAETQCHSSTSVIVFHSVAPEKKVTFEFV